MKKRPKYAPRAFRRKSTPVSSGVSRDARAAWSQLRAIGGFEPNGRDGDLEERLRMALRPSSTSLDDALSQCTTDQLVETFFGLLQPYVAMFRATLNFFQRAGAREGREAWSIRLEQENLELSHFQSFLSTMDSLPFELEVPAIDRSGIWAWHRAAQAVVGFPNLSQFLESGARATTGNDDVDEWVVAYKKGQYRRLPHSIQPNTFEGPVRDMAAVAAGTLDIIRRTWRHRDAMIAECRTQGFRSDLADGFSPPTIAQAESDHRLLNMSIHLAAFRSLAAEEQKKYADALKAELSPYPRRKLGIKANSEVLERILQLPVWRSRHELYAVWIATEIVNAAPDDFPVLHHENGRITFSFKETVVATFPNTNPLIRLYAERRSPLAHPLGEGRKNNVQPDFGLWRETEQQEECGVVVEVKHYKRDAPGRFKEVLADYGRAHPKAEILLVSHGPARLADCEVPRDVYRRSQIIGELTASSPEKRAALHAIISAFFRNSIVSVDRIDEPRAVAIDISLSMSPVLADAKFLSLVKSLGSNDSTPLLLVDSEIRRTARLCDIEEAVRTTPRGTATHLTKPIAEVLKSQPSVLVITDAEGLASIRGITVKRVRNHSLQSAKVEVALITRP